MHIRTNHTHTDSALTTHTDTHTQIAKCTHKQKQQHKVTLKRLTGTQICSLTQCLLQADWGQGAEKGNDLVAGWGHGRKVNIHS